MKRNSLIYGAGGAGKSTLAAQEAEWIWKNFKKRTRVVNADPGGTASAFAHLIEAGIADLWDIDTWDNASIFSTLDQATKGWWPQDLTVPNTILAPPVKEWRPCPKCGKDSGGTAFGMVKNCRECGTIFAMGQILPLKREPLNGMENVGLYVFEGMSAFGGIMLRALRNADTKGANTIKEQEFTVASPGQAHYLMAQSYLAQFIANSRKIPVDYIVWTALEYRGDDEGKPVYGPAGPGRALTTACIPWFTDVMHLDIIQKKKGALVEKDSNGMEMSERKLFLEPHFAPDNPMYKFAAKTSAPASMPKVLPADMSVFFAELEKANTAAKSKLNV